MVSYIWDLQHVAYFIYFSPIMSIRLHRLIGSGEGKGCLQLPGNQKKGFIHPYMVSGH